MRVHRPHSTTIFIGIREFFFIVVFFVCYSSHVACLEHFSHARTSRIFVYHITLATAEELYEKPSFIHFFFWISTSAVTRYIAICRKVTENGIRSACAQSKMSIINEFLRCRFEWKLNAICIGWSGGSGDRVISDQQQLDPSSVTVGSQTRLEFKRMILHVTE